MKYTTVKEAIKESGRDSVEEVLETYDEDVLEAGLELGIPASTISEAYQGKYSGDEDFAQQLAEDLGCISNDNKWPNYCIDWEYAAREVMMDYAECNGHYFRNL